MEQPHVSIIMGSDSDLNVMQEAYEVLKVLGVPAEMTVVSAHRTPERLAGFSQNAHKRGIKVIIAGAGGAAHLPGMVASMSPLPVIGVPVKASISLEGFDSLLSIVQMPPGVPVATVAVNGARNAGILAAQMLSIANNDLQLKIIAMKAEMKEKVLIKAKNMEDNIKNEHSRN